MIAVGCSHVSGLFVLPSSRLLALMWFARQVLITRLGLTPVTRRRFSRRDDRPINIRDGGSALGDREHRDQPAAGGSSLADASRGSASS